MIQTLINPTYKYNAFRENPY